MRLQRLGAAGLLTAAFALGVLAPALAAAAACCLMAGEAAAESGPCPALGAASCCDAPAAAESGKLSSPPAPARAPAPGWDSSLPVLLRAALAAPAASDSARLATVVLRL